MIILRKFLVCLILFINLNNFVFSDQMLRDTFENNPDQRWMYFADTVMGGQSSGAVDFGKSGQKNYARLTGNVTTSNNGGFIQIRKSISGLSENIIGINLQAKGNNQVYHIFLRTSGTLLPWHYYKAEFSAKKAWENISIPIGDFQRSSGFLAKKIKPETIKSIGLVAFGRDFSADLMVSEIYFY